MSIRSTIAPLCATALLAIAVLAQSGQSGEALQSGQSPSVPGNSAGTAARPASRSDSEIQKCIQGKLANSEKLRVQEFNVSVANSEATFTGAARNAGSKGAATRIGQSCGAAKIVNNISAPAIPRPARKVPGNGEGRTSL